MSIRLLRVSSPGCGPCEQLARVLPAMLAGRDIDLQHIDASRDPRRAAALRVRSVPTLIAVHGDEEVGRMVGFAGRDPLMAFLEGLPSLPPG
jgi:thioredoxin-like negative regulator of GroEL